MFDVDGTLTSERVWQGIMNYFNEHRQKRLTNTVFIGYHYPLYLLRKLGFLTESDFRRQWAAHLAWYLRGYTRQEGDKVWEWVVSEYLSDFWRRDVTAILDRHLRNGDLVMLVSSGPLPLMRRVAREFKVSHVVATDFEISRNRYTGRPAGEVCIDEFKGSMLLDYLEARRMEVDLRESYAYADSVADLHLLGLVGHPVVVYPDEILLEIAQEQGWEIIPPPEG